MIFSGILGSSGFVLGTYASQDYDLSEAEKYYTKLAYDMNEKILKVSSDTDWKNGLAAFGANKRNLKDEPDNWYWGRSSVYNWDPVYDSFVPTTTISMRMTTATSSTGVMEVIQRTC